MKRLFLTILCGVGLSLNLVVAESVPNLENYNKNSIKENLAIYSTIHCVNSDLFQTDEECVEIAVKIGEKLKKDGLNFALLDEYYKQNFKTLQNEYFIDLLQATNSYEILKFYLDNGLVVNENSQVLSHIGGEILIFIAQNCDTAKQAIKSKQPTTQILEFTKTEKYTNFRNKQLKIANEILRRTNKKDFIAKSKSVFDDLIAITNDEKIENFIKGEK